MDVTHVTLSQPKPGAIRGFHVPLKKYAGLGACYRPGSVWTTRTQAINVLPASNTIWSSVTTTSACYIHGLYHRFRYLHLTSYLALTQFVVTRRVYLSRFAPRTTLSSCFVTLSGQLLIHAPRFARWYGRSPTSLWGQLLQATSCRRKPHGVSDDFGREPISPIAWLAVHREIFRDSLPS